MFFNGIKVLNLEEKQSTLSVNTRPSRTSGNCTVKSFLSSLIETLQNLIRSGQETSHSQILLQQDYEDKKKISNNEYLLKTS